MDTETFYCILKPGGVAVESPDASKWCIPRTFIERSPVLRSLITDVEEGSSFQLPAPEGYVQAWLRAVSKHSEDHGSVEEMGSGIIAADYLADEELLKSLCGALGQVVGHYCLPDSPCTPTDVDVSSIPQVLQELSGPLVATVLRAAPVSLAQQLRRLPPSTHPHAMHAAHPELCSKSTLTLGCHNLDPFCATLALKAVAQCQIPPLHTLKAEGIMYLPTRQNPNVPDSFVNAFTTTCMGAQHVSLDFRKRRAFMTKDPIAAHMDPSATEGMLRGLGGNNGLESLEVHSSEDAVVAAFLEGGGCALQLKSLKLDIEGHNVEAALQAMAACTALTHLSLKCAMAYCFSLAASLQCMKQLQELHLKLDEPEPQNDRTTTPSENADDRACDDRTLMDPMLYRIRKPGVSFNTPWMRWGMRTEGKVFHHSLGEGWRLTTRQPTTFPSNVHTPSIGCDPLGDVLSHLPALTSLSLRGSLFRKNPGRVARVPHTVTALQHYSVDLPEGQSCLREWYPLIVSGVEFLTNLQELSFSLKATKESLLVKRFVGCAPAEVISLLNAMSTYQTHSVCTSLQLSVLPGPERAVTDLCERLTAFTNLQRLRMSRLNDAVGRRPIVQRLLLPQNDLASLGVMLTKLTYLKIGVSFAETALQIEQQYTAGRGAAGRGGGIGVRGALGRGRGAYSMHDSFCMSGLISMLQRLTLLQHLSMYSEAPNAHGRIFISAPDEGEVQALGGAMQGLTRLFKLTLKGSKLCSASICACVVLLTSLKDLNLDGEFNASKVWSESTMRGFSSLQHLQHLTISRLHWADALKSVAQLLHALAPAGELKALIVQRIPGPGSAEAFREFAGSLKGLPRLQVLSICSARFVQHCAPALAESLVYLLQLKKLTVEMCELTGADVHVICKSLWTLPDLAWVQFRYNRMQQQDIQAVNEVLKACERLRSEEIELQMPFMQCPCCDYFTVPRWTWYNACLEKVVPCPIYLKVPEEFIERWRCSVCQWNSWQTPGAEDIEILLDQKTAANSSTLREARNKFQEVYTSGTVQDHMKCGLDEFARFEVKPRDVELEPW